MQQKHQMRSQRVRATRTCTISQHSSNIHAAVKSNRWPGDRGTRDVVPEAQHTQTMELSPGKSEYPARVLERSARVHGGRAGGRKNAAPF